MSSAKTIALGVALLSSVACDQSESSNDSEPALDAAVDATGPDAASDAVVSAADATVDAETSACAPFVMPSSCTIPTNSVLPADLDCTGLYRDFAKRELRCDVSAYKPAYELWSDGAAKQRYVSLPAGSKIDARDPNALVFPVGTKLWKEFRTPDGARLLETRLLEKSKDGWLFTSYVWNAEQTAATQENEGVTNLHGTGHDVPTRDQCGDCHNGRVDRVLGWDAWLLGAGSSGTNRAELATRGAFDTGRELAVLGVPGDDIERAALGYLHVNCGVTCHNGSPEAKARDTGLMLRLEGNANSTGPSAPAYTTGAFRALSSNVKLGSVSAPDGGTAPSYYRDLVPLDPARSLLLARMKTRGDEGQMPPIATSKVDDAGVASVTRWIEQMTVARGYTRDGGL